jgi:hypothetical protein
MSIPVTLDFDVGVRFTMRADNVFVGIEGDAASLQVAIGGVDKIECLAAHCEFLDDWM